ncbi:LuxR family transcriptional regulator [Mycolicibacterium chubuense]|uniref:Serine/threonine-protein kinase PknK n=1 Tax=Mycolicibacterium chubuense TaxID=1800 RepID=A0A0J6ZID7_MYCCU|nr:AAA family ATPase [Mycolicibacterium chubuense]KMO84656.1 Serine/threonine-protein kinase PknK [Mycolicibacterium chubuense]ORA47608.1 LuxR family transcriptional regulator [Mycolicibacterium chubuense]SPY00320.1 regulatory protein LuxR [Mycolicibacterium chubuense]
MVAGDWRAYVPTATVGRPRIVDTALPRADLVDQLAARGDAHLVTVTAPAGYGKTTAVALWDDADPRPFAWVRVDHLDEDPAHLLLHIASAVAAVRPVDCAVLTYLRGPGRDPLTHLLPALSAALEATGPLVLVIDDAHHLSAADAVAALHAVIFTAPAHTAIAVVGRHQLRIELARRRLMEEVVEIDASALQFSDEEAAALLVSVSGLDRRARAIPAVVELCEGWPAGIMLTAMALRGGASVESLGGRRGPLADYLVEEVLDLIEPATARFLLESSVLERFTAAQLDAMLGRDDSARMIDALADAGNPFLVVLDQHGIWFRYHRLFADVLRQRLRTIAPHRFRELAIRGADLLEREEDIDGALQLALAAGDEPRAAALVGRDAVRLGFDGRAGVLARRLALLEPRVFAEYPDAALARAWLGVTTGDADAIHRSLMLAHHADRGAPLADGTPSVKVAAALVGSLIGVGGIEEVLHCADVVRAAGDSLVNPWWGAATVMKGAAESMRGQTPQARLLLESALPVTDDLPGFQAAALAHLALLDLAAGDDAGAIERSDAARTLVDKYDLCDVVPMVVVYAVSAVMAARTGDVSTAHESVEVTEHLLDRLGRLAARTALLGYGLLAWTDAVLGDRDLLAVHLHAAERARRREPGAIALSARVDRVRAMVAGNAHPLTAAELRLLPLLATHFSLQQIADDLMIGRETAKSQATSVYRKLGVSTRAAAVDEARRIGLLSG